MPNIKLKGIFIIDISNKNKKENKIYINNKAKNEIKHIQNFSKNIEERILKELIKIATSEEGNEKFKANLKNKAFISLCICINI